MKAALDRLADGVRQRWRHIAIEGPIGVGKSSLARKLARTIDADLMLELPEPNPFLERFYADGSRYAFQTQMFFLFQRVEQYRKLSQTSMFDRPVVADFMFEKDAIFARLTLDDEEFRLYGQMTAHLAHNIVKPELVIWLRASPEVLLQRIARRGLAMERSIDAATLQRLSDAYARHFQDHPSMPVLAIDTEQFNPYEREEDFQTLLERLAGFAGGHETVTQR